jgi:hypothetical protein
VAVPLVFQGMKTPIYGGIAAHERLIWKNSNIRKYRGQDFFRRFLKELENLILDAEEARSVGRQRYPHSAFKEKNRRAN